MALLICFLLLGIAEKSQAQIYYVLSDPSAANTSDDAIKRIAYDGTQTVVRAPIASSPNTFALDLPNNRAFVYNLKSTGNTIDVVNLTTGVASASVPVPTGTTTLPLMRYDPIGNYLYYTANNGTGVADDVNALYRLKPDGSENLRLVPRIGLYPSWLALNIENNKIYVYDGIAAGRKLLTVDITTNTVVYTADLKALYTQPHISAIEYDKTTDYIYYTSTIGQYNDAVAADDALGKMKPDGTGRVIIKASVIRNPIYLALDAAHGNAYLYEGYIGAVNTIVDSQQGIYKVNLSDGTTTSFVSMASLPSPPAVSLPQKVWGIASAQLPYVTTSAATLVTAASATANGNVSRSDEAVTARGVVYSSSNTTPTIGGTNVTNATASVSTGTGAFTASLSSLSPVTTYYVRAYATSVTGTTYGAVQTFITTSNDATLSAFAISSGTLNPTFAAATTTYTASVANATTAITVTPTRNQASATIKVNNTTVASGSASGSLALNIGDNTITTVVTAQDGTTTKTYTLTVNRPKVVQTITFASTASKTYGDADFAAGGSINTSLTIAYASSNTAVATVSGSTIHIVGAGTATITASQAGDANNAAATSVTQTLTVNKASQTITFGTIAAKTYGDADFAAGGSVNSNLTVSYASDNTAVATIVSGQIHIVGAGSANITAAQAGDANRSAATSVVQALSVNKNAIAVTAAANQTKVYGNADPASYTYTITTGTLKSGDSFTGALARAAGTDVGTYAINIGTLSLSNNYTLTYTGANFTITKRPLELTPTVQTKAYGDNDPASYTYQFTSGTSLASTDGMTGLFVRATGEIPGVYAFSLGTKHPVNAGSGVDVTSNYTLSFVSTNLTITKRLITLKPIPATKVYGNADPTYPYQFTVGSVAPGEGMTGTFGRAAGEDVGAYALTLGTKRPVNASTGAATDQYYTISFISDNLTITKRTVNVNANTQTKTYGDTDPALTYSADALGYTDTFSGTLTRATGQTIGTYAISQGTLALNTTNYTLNFTGATLTIGKKIVNVTASTKTKTYGDADPTLNYNADALASGDSFTGALSRAAGEGFGTYAISQGNLALNSNYTVNFTGANLTINKKAISVFAGAKTKTYGDGDPALTYTADALISGDSFTGAISRAGGESAGTYAINQGTLALSSNYTLNYTSANLTIGKRGITIDSYAPEVQYGNADATISYSYGGTLASGDAVTGALGREPGTAVGSYAVNLGTVTVTHNESYDITFHTSTYKIIPREIQVTGGSTFKIYGDSDPAINYSIYSGTLLGGTQITGALERVAGEAAGPYNVGQGTVAINDANYKLTYLGGYFEIDRAPLTLTINNQTKVATHPNPALTYSVTGYKNGDTEATAFTSAIQLTTDATLTSAAGTYNIYPIGGVYSPNYDLTTTGGTLTVTPASTINTLASATLNGGGFDGGAFDPATDFYSVSVPNGSTSATLVVTVTDPLSTISIGYDPATATTVASGAPYTITFTGGNTEQVPVNVTAEDGTVHSYYFNVTPIPSDSKLSNLDSDFGIIAPSFNPLVTSYTLDVSAGTDSVTITPTTHDRLATARVSGGGEGGANGAKKIGVNEGGNPVNIVVRSADRTSTSFYSLYIKRPIRLKTLTLSAGNLIPAFDPNITSYVAKVPESIPAISVTPQGNQSYFQMEVNGDYVNYGDASAPVTINADGSTTIVVKITAGDGETSKTYTINVQHASTDATLAGITLSQGSLDPVFDSTKTDYNVYLPNNTNALTFTPTTTDANATIKVNNAPLAAGESVTNSNIHVGLQNYYIAVTAADGATTKTYTLSVHRAYSTEAGFSNILLSAGTLSPTFDQAMHNTYDVIVPGEVSSIDVTPVLIDTTASLQARLNGHNLPPANGVFKAALSTGINSLIITSTAQDGTTLAITSVIIKRIGDPSLSNLAVSTPTTFSPPFNKDTYSYTAAVEYPNNTYAFTPTLMDPANVLKVNGNVVTNDVETSVSLSVGDNTITIEVTAADSTSKTYTIVVSRAAPATDNYLSGLTLSGGRFLFAFDSNGGGMPAVVPNALNEVTVTPVATDAKATITVNYQTVLSGMASQPLAVPGTYNVQVTAEDGNTRNYQLQLKYLSTNAKLYRLESTSGGISPTFDRDVEGYTLTVPSNVSSTGIIAQPADSTARVSINGASKQQNYYNYNVALGYGANTVQIAVSPQEGADKTYTLTITRALSSETTLAGVTLSQGTLSPTFDGSVTAYTAAVPNNTASVTVTPSPADANGSITAKVNGANAVITAGTIVAPLNVGNNTIAITSIAQDGSTVQTYSIAVNRAEEAILSGLVLSTGNLSPTFNKHTYNYLVTVPSTSASITATATTAAAGATLKVNGVAAASGVQSAPAALATGVNTLAVEVTVGGVAQTYNLTVTRQKSAYLSKITLVPYSPVTRVGNIGSLDYTASVSSATSSIRLNLVAEDAGASIKLNGAAISSGVDTAPVALPGAATTIGVEVTSADGLTVKTYHITINKTGSANTGLSNIAISPGVLATGGTADSYTASVSNSAGSVQVTLGTKDPATIKINGIITAQNTASAPITLTGVTTAFPVEVTAEDGITKRTITITVNKTGSTSTAISSIAISPGVLVSAGTDNYTASVSNSASSVQVKLGTKDPATIMVNGVATAQNTASAPVTLTGPATTFAVEITAEDGVTKRTITITVNKTGSNNTGLSNLAISPGSLTRAGTTDSYTAVVSGVNSVQVTLGTKDPATIKINGIVTAQNTASAPIMLTGAATTFPVEVTAEDGVTKRIITITVNKTGSNNTGLSNIAISPGVLVSAGIADSYTASVSNSTGSVTMMVGTKEPATIKVNGVATAQNTASAPVTLTGASSTFVVEITAEDGVTKRTITITVNKTGSSNTGLSTLAINTGPLTRVGTTDTWTASVSSGVSSVRLTFGTKDPATIKIDGVTTDQNTASAPIMLAGATTNIPVEITAEDGVTKRNITVTVNRATPPVIAAITAKQGGISKIQETEQAPELQPEDIAVKQAVSPNGDGINDRFTIEGIQSFPENTVRIMNRNGDVIYEAKGYDNEGKAFDGHSSKGTMQQPGTYFYSIEYKKGTESKRKTGYIVVKY